MQINPTEQQVQKFQSFLKEQGVTPTILPEAIWSFLSDLLEAGRRAPKAKEYVLPEAKVGDIVLFQPNLTDRVARSNNNEDRIPAIITRVWSALCVNLKIIPDNGPMQDRSSVVHQSLNRANFNFIFKDEMQERNNANTELIRQNFAEQITARNPLLPLVNP